MPDLLAYNASDLWLAGLPCATAFQLESLLHEQMLSKHVDVDVAAWTVGSFQGPHLGIVWLAEHCLLAFEPHIKVDNRLHGKCSSLHNCCVHILTVLPEDTTRWFGLQKASNQGAKCLCLTEPLTKVSTHFPIIQIIDLNKLELLYVKIDVGNSTLTAAEFRSENCKLKNKFWGTV